MPKGRFDNRTAIVKCTSSGNDRAVANILASEGASVVINDVRAGLVDSVVEDIEDAGGSAMRCVADVSVQDKVRAMVSAAVDHFGAVDMLVNNAGILRKSDGLESISLEKWQAVLDVNLTGVSLCTKAVLPIMKERGSGRIVNVSSPAGRSSSVFGGAQYTSSRSRRAWANATHGRGGCRGEHQCRRAHLRPYEYRLGAGAGSVRRTRGHLQADSYGTPGIRRGDGWRHLIPMLRGVLLRHRGHT